MRKNKEIQNGVNFFRNRDGVNREYKDRLFRYIFGNPQNKEWTLSLYNAINNSSYTDADQIVMNTINDILYMGMKNDVSFLVDETMCFYEQQSTFNPNMPVRYLVYAGMTYAKYIESNKNYHIYSTSRRKLPVPKCVCFYNGKQEKDDIMVLKLSDSFDFGEKTDIEVSVTMININYGHNKELLGRCQPFEEYSWLISKIRECLCKNVFLEAAVDLALDEMPENSLIKPFLIENRAEVKYMFLTEYDEERTMAEMREDGREEGREEGRADILKLAAALVQEGRYDDITRIAEDPEYLNMLLDKYLKNN